MNSADRRKAKRRAFRQGQQARARMATILRMDDPSHYHIDEKSLRGFNVYRPERNRYRSASRRRQTWGDFTKLLAGEFDRGWGPL